MDAPPFDDPLKFVEFLKEHGISEDKIKEGTQRFDHIHHIAEGRINALIDEWNQEFEGPQEAIPLACALERGFLALLAIIEVTLAENHGPLVSGLSDALLAEGRQREMFESIKAEAKVFLEKEKTNRVN